MKKKYILGILFFGSLWGFSEAVLGGFLYRNNMPHASVYLTIIGFSILTIASGYFPQKGIAVAIAAFAMLYKFMNTPFFACHLLGILLLGICYDLFFNFLRLKNRSISAVLAVYSGYTLLALMLTYVFRYSHWTEAGGTKIVNHIGVGGTLAALGCAMIVPLSYGFGEWLQTKKAYSADLAGSFVRGRLAFVTAGMWLFALVTFMVQYHRIYV